ncbi:MAG TPA: hypothetical protein VIO14_03725 [Dehalococcoidia bacterium]
MAVTGRRRRRLRRAVWATVAAVLAIQAVFVVLNLKHRSGPWDLEAEYGYPALLDAGLLAAGSLLCLAYGLWGLLRPQAAGRPRGWLALGLVLAWLFTDATLALHERVVPELQPWLAGSGVTLPPWFWLIPYTPLMVVSGLVILSQAWHLYGRDRLAGAACVLGLACWGGAVLVEPLGLELWQFSHPYLYTVAVVVEETLEVAGALGVLAGVARYAAADAAAVAPAPEPEPAGAGSR